MVNFYLSRCVVSREAPCHVWAFYGACAPSPLYLSPLSVVLGFTLKNPLRCPILKLQLPSVFGLDYGGSVLLSKGSIPPYVSTSVYAILLTKKGEKVWQFLEKVKTKHVHKIKFSCFFAVFFL